MNPARGSRIILQVILARGSRITGVLQVSLARGSRITCVLQVILARCFRITCVLRVILAREIRITCVILATGIRITCVLQVILAIGASDHVRFASDSDQVTLNHRFLQVILARGCYVQSPYGHLGADTSPVAISVQR